MKKDRGEGFKLLIFIIRMRWKSARVGLEEKHEDSGPGSVKSWNSNNKDYLERLTLSHPRLFSFFSYSNQIFPIFLINFYPLYISLYFPIKKKPFIKRIPKENKIIKILFKFCLNIWI